MTVPAHRLADARPHPEIPAHRLADARPHPEIPAHRLADARPHPRVTFTVVNTCVGCGACIVTCPERAFRAVRPAAVGEPPLVVLAARCTACGECAEVCPVDACVEVEHDDASD